VISRIYEDKNDLKQNPYLLSLFNLILYHIHSSSSAIGLSIPHSLSPLAGPRRKRHILSSCTNSISLTTPPLPHRPPFFLGHFTFATRKVKIHSQLRKNGLASTRGPVSLFGSYFGFEKAKPDIRIQGSRLKKK
jgi:hypothetical protein